MYVEITIPASVPSWDWHRLATKRAREGVHEIGADWKEAQILVTLPEGRYFYKASGADGLGSYR